MGKRKLQIQLAIFCFINMILVLYIIGYWMVADVSVIDWLSLFAVLGLIGAFLPSED